MKVNKTTFRRVWYKFKHDLLTVNNVVTLAALLIAFGFTWSAISSMNKNYELQRRVDSLKREQLVLELETATLEYERNYHQTEEYQELAVRERLGLGSEGESLLVLPENSQAATDRYKESETVTSGDSEEADNLGQWMKFLFGSNGRKNG